MGWGVKTPDSPSHTGAVSSGRLLLILNSACAPLSGETCSPISLHSAAAIFRARCRVSGYCCQVWAPLLPFPSQPSPHPFPRGPAAVADPPAAPSFSFCQHESCGGKHRPGARWRLHGLWWSRPVELLARGSREPAGAGRAQ